MRLVVVTGMSGSGKVSALKMLEDVGYYCVDNLPVLLIETFADLVSEKNSEFTKVALGVDVRVDQPFEEVVRILDKVRSKNITFEILFLEADKATLLKRYKESRRMHPLSSEGRVEDGILKERKILEDIRSKSDYIIDTSKLLTRELKEKIDAIFVEDKKHNDLFVDIVSFGFKRGIPQDADLVFDVRFLPNPFYIEELKPLTGLDEKIQDYVLGFPEAVEFLNMLESMLDFLVPNYLKEGKHQLVVAIGCTGGHHRSVTLAGKLYERMLSKNNVRVRLSHRDIKLGV
ncbi:MAG: RNase adapter RapZ [Lachnospiraceae bacterium]|nr:RNase adapter RapZ [Lachnospiraceae bacterium]